MKKFAAFLLSLAMIFSLAVPAFAVDAEVGELTIISIEGQHAFITFKNTYSDPVRIGGLSVNRGQEITLGTFGNRPSHKGIWYNLESYIYHNGGASQFAGRVSLTTTVTKSEMSDINAYIKSNDTWSNANNCASFAVKIWNMASTTTLSSGSPSSPDTLAARIRAVSGYITTKSIPNSSPVGYVSNGLWYDATRAISPRVASQICATPVYPVVEAALPADFNFNLYSGTEKK